MVIVIIALALMLSLWSASRYAARHLRHINLYEKYSNEYYKFSRPLISSDDTPRALLELMLFINRKMPNPHSGRQFLLSLLLRPGNDKLEAQWATKQDEIAGFLKARPELAHSFERACCAALRAMSYRSLFAGILMRRLFLFDDNEAHERPVQLVFQLEKRMSHGNGGGLGGAFGC